MYVSLIYIIPGIKTGFHQKLGKVRDALVTDISVYSVMGTWKLR